MRKGEDMIPEEMVGWLIEPENPSVKYRTMVELLDRPQDEIGVRKSKSQIPTSCPVKILLDGMHPDGYWLQRDPRTGKARAKRSIDSRADSGFEG
jgi:hypothetical protein